MLRSCSAFVAPSSTTTPPRIDMPLIIQRLRLSRRLAAAGKSRAQRLTVDQARDGLRLQAAGEYDVGTSGGRQAGGRELADHAAATACRRAASVALDRRVDAFDALD